jgi:fucose permease
VTGLSPVPALGSETAPAEQDSRRAGWALDALSLGSFVALGLPDGMLGTAWPSARQTFGAPIADLGLILLISTIGAISVSAFVGTLIRRFGVAVLLACSGACAALAGTGYALAPHLWVLFAVAVLWGLAAGMMDGGLNTAVGLSGRSRLLNLLHAAYGVGTTIGPLLVTAAILLSSWRSAYLVLAVLDLVVTALWLRQQRQERPARDAPSAAATEPAQAGQAAAGETAAGHPSDAWSRRRSGFVVAAGMLIFFVYTGIEVAAGQWEASFCRGHLGLSASAAGLATFGFWGALTAVRLILAVLPRPVPPSRVVWWGSGIAVAAAALIWWQPGTPATLAAFVLLGGALAGVFPALIALTPLRIGRGRAQHAIAWQVGAAAGGGSGLSALIGLLIGVWGLSVLGPSLTVLAVLLVAGIILLERTAPIAQPAVAAGPVDLRIASRRRMLGPRRCAGLVDVLYRDPPAASVITGAGLS